MVVILDPETLLPCPIGTTGELFVAGANLAREYWNRPKKTKETFLNMEIENVENDKCKQTS